jgi:hypothetical protein
MTVTSLPVVKPKARPTPKGLLSLVYLGEGIFAVHSLKYSKKGTTEAVYPVYANGLICPCPAIVHGRERTGICKHLRLVCDYLAGGPDSLEFF